MEPYYQTKNCTIFNGDCRTILATLEENSVDAIVTDPPYELGFMGKAWDRSGIANDATMWAECLRVLKLGGHLLAFGGSRTYHRMACAIEDAGFEIRDQIMWLYGSGFPKSLDVSKAIDKAAGAQREVVAKSNSGAGASPQKLDNHAKGDTGVGILDGSGKTFDITAPATDAAKQWQGFGTALKSSHEPIVVARKPLIGTVAANVLQHGTGALNIDACRIGYDSDADKASATPGGRCTAKTGALAGGTQHDGERGEFERPEQNGRWPANLIHDGSDEVVSRFPQTASGQMKAGTVRAANDHPGSVCYGTYGGNATSVDTFADSGSAARFFYTAKADAWDRNEGLQGLQGLQQDASRKQGNPGGDNPRNRGVHVRANNHPTVKPTDLMRYLCRLVTPPGGLVLDPFMGSGSTYKAANEEGLRFIGIEIDAHYCEIASLRVTQSVFDFSATPTDSERQ